jgi:membrane-bound serine protease (ClpP class)
MRSRRTAARAIALAALVLAALASWVGDAASAPRDAASVPTEGGKRGIVIVQVNGLLDPPNAALITKSVHDAERARASLVAFQLSGSGAVDVDVDSLVRTINRSSVPIAVWVGPSGGQARGASALLALSAAYVSVAPGAHIGPIAPIDFGHPHAPGQRADAERVAAQHPGRNVGAVFTHRLSGSAAVEQKVVDGNEPTIGQFIAALNGKVLSTANGDVRMSTSTVVGVGANRKVQANQDVRFRKLDLTQQLAHTLNTPWVAYFLFVAGLALMLLEFYTASVGIAGFVGALCLVGGCFGFSHLPVSPWGIALLVIGMLGLAIDLQAGGLGPWTFIGGAALIAGSLWLYDGATALDPAWWILVLVCGSTLLFVLSGMTAMVRSRFSTPTMGREELIGEMGVAEVGVDPDGVVRVRDALWRARTNRATPIAAGDAVRVVAVEGVLLEVEPEAGGARDYRKR